MIWSSLIGLVGKIFGGVFGLKQKQGEIVQGALKTFESVQVSDSAYFAASSEAINSVYKNGGWLERGWRPTLMWACITINIARWAGYELPHLSPEELQHIYNFTYIGLGGYMPLRSMDKWMQGFQIGNILKKFVEKKII